MFPEMPDQMPEVTADAAERVMFQRPLPCVC